jgi:hypothetical protein
VIGIHVILSVQASVNGGSGAALRTLATVVPAEGSWSRAEMLAWALDQIGPAQGRSRSDFLGGWMIVFFSAEPDAAAVPS